MHKVVYELCPICGNEVKLRAKLDWQQCPKCKTLIKPCAMCDMDTVDCTNCKLEENYTPTLESIMNLARLGIRDNGDFERFMDIIYQVKELTEKTDIDQIIDELYAIYESKV